jgi:hypothetical protein
MMHWPKEFDRIWLAQELFDIGLPHDAETWASLQELVDWFELRLVGWGPNSEAARFLRKMAHSQNNPRLAEGLHAEWRREQIEAVIREIFGDELLRR